MTYCSYLVWDVFLLISFSDRFRVFPSTIHFSGESVIWSIFVLPQCLLFLGLGAFSTEIRRSYMFGRDNRERNFSWIASWRQKLLVITDLLLEDPSSSAGFSRLVTWERMKSCSWTACRLNFHIPDFSKLAKIFLMVNVLKNGILNNSVTSWMLIRCPGFKCSYSLMLTLRAFLNDPNTDI